MARRCEMITTRPYLQTLKMRFYERMVLTNHAQVISKLGYKKPDDGIYKIRSWAKFNQNTFNGVQLIAGLYLKATPKICATCTFKIHLIAADDNWTETLITIVSGVLIGQNKFKAVLPETIFSPLEIAGQNTFKIEVILTRYDDQYHDFFYINDLGLNDEVNAIKNKITFLELTKLDE
jgi:hypothetical protein